MLQRGVLAHTAHSTQHRPDSRKQRKPSCWFWCCKVNGWMAFNIIITNQNIKFRKAKADFNFYVNKRERERESRWARERERHYCFSAVAVILFGFNGFSLDLDAIHPVDLRKMYFQAVLISFGICTDYFQLNPVSGNWIVAACICIYSKPKINTNNCWTEFLFLIKWRLKSLVMDTATFPWQFILFCKYDFGLTRINFIFKINTIQDFQHFAFKSYRPIMKRFKKKCRLHNHTATFHIPIQTRTQTPNPLEMFKIQ